MKYLLNIEKKVEQLVAKALEHKSIAHYSISKQEATDALLMIGKLTGQSPVRFAKSISPMSLLILLFEKETEVVASNRIEGRHPQYSNLLIQKRRKEPLPLTPSALKWWFICTLLLRKRGHRP